MEACAVIGDVPRNDVVVQGQVGVVEGKLVAMPPDEPVCGNGVLIARVRLQSVDLVGFSHPCGASGSIDFRCRSR